MGGLNSIAVRHAHNRLSRYPALLKTTSRPPPLPPRFPPPRPPPETVSVSSPELESVPLYCWVNWLPLNSRTTLKDTLLPSMVPLRNIHRTAARAFESTCQRVAGCLQSQRLGLRVTASSGDVSRPFAVDVGRQRQRGSDGQKRRREKQFKFLKHGMPPAIKDAFRWAESYPGGQRGNNMALCAYCQKVTELYDGGTAVCVECSRGRETSPCHTTRFTRLCSRTSPPPRSDPTRRMRPSAKL